MTPETLEDVESRRLCLEENVAKLRKSLQRWQMWDAEYEGLKEEILAQGDTMSFYDLLAVGRDLKGTLVDEEEIRTLLHNSHGGPRSKKEVVDVLSRRMDYVQQNVQTIEKQLALAANELNSTTMAKHSDARDEDGLPLTEILEELDDDGNVISSTTTTAGKEASELLKVLRKAGVEDSSLPSSSDTQSQPHGQGDRSHGSPAETQAGVARAQASSPSASPSSQLSDWPNSRRERKSVSFTKDTKPAAAPENPQRTVSSEFRNGVRSTSSGKTGTSSPTVDPGYDADESAPIIPANESVEDALLRRQMLDYSLSEVGAVVAELELDDSGCQDSLSDEDEGLESQSTTDEEEDDHGRTTKKMVDDDYQAEMEALAKKLGVSTVRNVGPKPDISVTAGTDVGKSGDVAFDGDHRKSPISDSAKKSVRFAAELDIASEPSREPTKSDKKTSTKPSKPPPQDAVVERNGSTSPHTPTTPSGPKKVSRFKGTRRSAMPNQTPASTSTDLQQSLESSTPPPDTSNDAVPTNPVKPLADTLVERDPKPPPSPTLSPDEDDDAGFDPALLRQQVAVEYHAKRNKLIHQQGGFLAGEKERERVPLTEEEGGRPRERRSRFMAARLGRDG